MTTAIRSGVPFVEYFASPGISISNLKRMLRSPAHYLTPTEETEPMRLGTAAHAAVLEPERFKQDFVVWRGLTKNGDKIGPRNGREWERFEQEAKAAGQTVLTVAQYDDAVAIARAVLNSADAMRYLGGGQGQAEVSMQWMLGERQCRGRADWITSVLPGPWDPQLAGPLPVLVGLKTARDCRKREFAIDAARLRYDMQWSWYFDGYFEITSREPKVVEIVVEKTPPYDVAVYRIPERRIESGRRLYRHCLEMLDECERTGIYRGSQVHEEDLDWWPQWATDDEDDFNGLAYELEDL